MGSSNILVWDLPQTNMQSDPTYSGDAQRSNGGIDGVAFPSALFNKFGLQTSAVAYAIGQLLASRGYVISDSNVPAIVTALQSMFANVPGKSPLQQLSYSPAQALNAALYLGFQITLAGNSVLTISGQNIGDTIFFIFIQDGVGGRTITWPSGFFGFVQPDPTANSISVQIGKVLADLSVHAANPMMSAAGINGTPIGATEPSTGDFTTLTLAAGAPSGQVLTGDGTKFIPATPAAAGITPNFVTGSRAFNTQYQNTGSNPMTVMAGGTLNLGVGHNASAVPFIGPSSASNQLPGNSVTNGPGFASATFIVPPGWFYEVQTHIFTDTDSLTLNSWVEYTY
jgi:hypothetical protein